MLFLAKAAGQNTVGLHAVSGIPEKDKHLPPPPFFLTLQSYRT